MDGLAERFGGTSGYQCSLEKIHGYETFWASLSFPEDIGCIVADRKT